GVDSGAEPRGLARAVHQARRRSGFCRVVGSKALDAPAQAEDPRGDLPDHRQEAEAPEGGAAPPARPLCLKERAQAMALRVGELSRRDTKGAGRDAADRKSKR